MHENENFEMKRQWDENVLRSIVAFLNSDFGGEIKIGINDDGSVRGIQNLDQTLLKITSKIRESISPISITNVSLSTQIIDNEDIICIKVQRGLLKPYYISKYGLSEKGCFIRVGSSTIPMPKSTIEELLSKRVRNSLIEIKCGVTNLSFEQLRIYYDEKGKSLNNQFESILKFRTSEGDYNILAYLMSDTNSTSIKFARYAGTTRVELIENVDFGKQSLIKSAKLILEKLILENNIQSLITPIERQDVSLWNPIAIREAVINAIVHNDYTRNSSPKIEIFDDRIEISSGGGLPQGININEFFQGHSVPRSPEIVRIFSDLDLVEQLGSGISRILEHYSKECFLISENVIRVTFPKLIKDFASRTLFNLKFKELLQQIESLNGLSDFGGNISSKNQIEKYISYTNSLTTEQIEVLKFVRQPKSNREIQEDLLHLKKHTDNFKRILEPMIANGLLSKSIPGTPSSPNQKYFISEKGKIHLYILSEKMNLINESD